MPPDDVMTRPADPPDAVLRYAPHDEGLVDMHLPPGPARPRPLVVYVHGGFWRQQTDRMHARPLAEALAAAGFVVAVPEYRRGEDAWAATSADLDTVLTGLPEMLADIGVETTSTTLVGHSAGGHLVLWLATQPHRVERVVALAPVGDLRLAVELDMGAGAAVAFFGGTPAQRPEVYDAADPGTRMHTTPRASVVVVHGDRDEHVPVQSSRRLHERFDWLDYREVAGADHFDVIDPWSDAWASVVLPCLTAEGSLPHGV